MSILDGRVARSLNPSVASAWFFWPMIAGVFSGLFAGLVGAGVDDGSLVGMLGGNVVWAVLLSVWAWRRRRRDPRPRPRAIAAGLVTGAWSLAALITAAVLDS